MHRQQIYFSSGCESWPTFLSLLLVILWSHTGNCVDHSGLDEFSNSSSDITTRIQSGWGGTHEFTLHQVFFRSFKIKGHELQIKNVCPNVTFGFGNESRKIKPESLSIRSTARYAAFHRGMISASHGAPSNILAQDKLMLEWTTIQNAVSSSNYSSPNVSDRATVINLAKMTSDAYIQNPEESEWLEIGCGFNNSGEFGWEADGLRGHIFADSNNETVIIAFKGTTIGNCFLGQYCFNKYGTLTITDLRDKTTTNDRLNDNLLFSCCCATQRPPPYWYGPVCGCREDVFQCNSTCLTQELSQNDRYYATALHVYHNVTKTYPKSQIWLVGHSLGGAMASLVGMTYNLPAVTFESPAQALAARRLGLSSTSPGQNRIPAFHFGHTADPVYMGACNGFFSSCAAGGFIFESQCFTGLRCVYDTVEDKGWGASVLKHRINEVISTVLEAYDSVPGCKPDDDCVDCYNWNFDNGPGHDAN